MTSSFCSNRCGWSEVFELLLNHFTINWEINMVNVKYAWNFAWKHFFFSSLFDKYIKQGLGLARQTKAISAIFRSLIHSFFFFTTKYFKFKCQGQRINEKKTTSTPHILVTSKPHFKSHFWIRLKSNKQFAQVLLGCLFATHEQISFLWTDSER